MRFLAIDLGDKRTGLAVGDAITRASVPLDVIEVPVERGGGADLLKAIADAVREQLAPATRAAGSVGPAEVLEPHSPTPRYLQEGGLVLGLPYNMDGTEGPRAKLVRTWAASIAKSTGHPILLVDERLSSAQADKWMARSGLTHKQKKARRDALAAAAILQRFLDNLPGGGTPAE